MIELINGDCCLELPKLLEKYSSRQVIIVTDPPFNIRYKYNSYKDNLKEEEYLKLLKRVLSNTPFVIIHYPEFLYKISNYLNRCPTRVVSWVYNSNTARQHRDIAFFDCQPDFKKVRQPYKNPDNKRIKERIERGCVGAKLYDWWNINQVKNFSEEKTSHPCQMPLDVMKNIIGLLPENALIIDPFMGSGTTGVACMELERDFVGIEIDEVYFDICQKRLKEKKECFEQLTLFDFMEGVYKWNQWKN